MGQHVEASELTPQAALMGRPAIASLQPKGSCWYCDQPVDNVRRFCSPGCRNDYLEEEASFFAAATPPAPPASA